jgi:hypothetical protein
MGTVFEDEQDVLEQLLADLQRPVRIDPALDARVMDEIAARRSRWGDGAAVAATWRWLTRPRQVAISPLLGLAVAASLMLLIAFPARRWLTAPTGRAGGESQPFPAGASASVAGFRSSREFQFVLVAPKAATVTLVGDFNDWDAKRTPMRRARGSAVWTTVVPLPPGRYRYAFLVNSSQWVADPAAPRVLDDEFNTPSSVVTVGGS